MTEAHLFPTKNVNAGKHLTCVREIKKKCMLEECLIPSVYYGRGKVMNGMGYCRVGRVKELYWIERTINQKGYFTSTVLHQHLLGANAIVQQDSSVFDGLDVTVTRAEPKGWLTGRYIFLWLNLVSVFMKYMFKCSHSQCMFLVSDIVCSHPTNTLLKPTGFAVNSFLKDWWIILWSNHLCNQPQCAAVPEEGPRGLMMWITEIWLVTPLHDTNGLLKYFSIHLNLRCGSHLLIGLSFFHSQCNSIHFTTDLNPMCSFDLSCAHIL